MSISSISVDHIWSQLTRYQKQLTQAVIVLLALYLIAYAAELTWRLIPQPEQASLANTNNTTVTSVRKSESPKANLSSIHRLHLFGEVGKKPVEVAPVVEDAPETKLSLTLTGLVASTTSDNGAAIIEHRGSQNTYGVGEKVEGTSAVVAEVRADRIILNNSGRMETLMLDGVDKTTSSLSTSRQNTNKQIAKTPKPKTRNTRKLNKDTIKAATALRSSPGKFTDFIAIQPYRAGGKLAGYKVNPGKDTSLFKAAGLQPNDILTEINGLDLSDMKQSMQAMQMLRTATSLDITVSRAGQPVSLNLELPEP